jgi:hypothetical protein
VLHPIFPSLSSCSCGGAATTATAHPSVFVKKISL